MILAYSYLVSSATIDTHAIKSITKTMLFPLNSKQWADVLY